MLTLDKLVIQVASFQLNSPSTLDFLDGEKVIVTGGNGSGKSVFLHALLDLVKDRRGEIRINGRSNREDGWQESVGAFLDRYFLIPFMTPREYLNYLAMVKKRKRNEICSLVHLAADFLAFDLNDPKLIRDLSEGNQKKIGLIGTLVGNPSLVVWDEPFANLDQKSVEGLTSLIGKLNGVLILYSSHEKLSAMVFDRHLTIRNGLLIEVTS